MKVIWLSISILFILGSCNNEEKVPPPVPVPQEDIQTPTTNNTPPKDPVKLDLELDKIKPTGAVHDYEDLFTKKEEQVLDSMIQNLERNTGVEMVIMTVKPGTTNATDFNFHTQQLMSIMGVGDPGKGNGIFIALSQQLRKLRINKGDGVMKFWPDAESQTLINSYMLPSYGLGEYFEGTTEALKVITDLVEHRAPKDWKNTSAQQ